MNPSVEAMNPSVEGGFQDRRQLAQHLHSLLGGFRFTRERSARCGDEAVEITIIPWEGDEGEVDHVMTVLAGFPPGPAVQGLLCTLWRPDGERPRLVKRGTTNRRGQVRWKGLPEGEFRVEVEGLVAEPIRAGVDRRQFAGAHGATAHPRQDFHSDDGAIEATLRVNPADRLILEVRAKLAALDDQRLVRFRFWSERHEFLLQGYLGLVPADDIAAEGVAYLDLMGRELRARLGDCDLEVAAQSSDDLAGLDPASRHLARRSLIESLDANVDPAGKAVLEAALARLPKE
jgi:hypothetical protein